MLHTHRPAGCLYLAVSRAYLFSLKTRPHALQDSDLFCSIGLEFVQDVVGCLQAAPVIQAITCCSEHIPGIAVANIACSHQHQSRFNSLNHFGLFKRQLTCLCCCDGAWAPTRRHRRTLLPDSCVHSVPPKIPQCQPHSSDLAVHNHRLR